MGQLTEALRTEVAAAVPYMGATALGAVLLQPLDVLATRQQQPRPVYYRLTLNASYILQTLGLRGLYRGTMLAMTRAALGSGLCLFASRFSRSSERKPIAETEASDNIKTLSSYTLGLAWRSGIAFFLLPLLTLKTRIESSIAPCQTLLYWIRTSYAVEGIRGLFRGAAPSMLIYLVFPITYLAVFSSVLQSMGYVDGELTREYCLPAPDDSHFTQPRVPSHVEHNAPVEDDDLLCPTLGMAGLDVYPDVVYPAASFFSKPYLLASCIAGLCAAVLTHPLDVLRTQMQLWRYGSPMERAHYNGSVQPGAQLLSPKDQTVQHVLPHTETRLLVKTASSQCENGGGLRLQPTQSKLLPQNFAAAMAQPVPRGAALFYPGQSSCVSPTLTEKVPGFTHVSYKYPQGGTVKFIYNMLQLEGGSVFWRGLIPRLAHRSITVLLGTGLAYYLAPS